MQVSPFFIGFACRSLLSGAWSYSYIIFIFPWPYIVAVRKLKTADVLNDAEKASDPECRSFSKHRSFFCFCTCLLMSLTWFFCSRASSGTLTQESKCGTPVTASSSPSSSSTHVHLCMCVHVGNMCVHPDFYLEESAKALQIHVCMSVSLMTRAAHACGLHLSPHSPEHLRAT